MPLVFAAITPHPPVLIPSVGKEHLSKLDKTKAAMEQLEQDLYSAKPDLVFVISPHGELFAEAFTVNLCDKFQANFQLFGDFTNKLEFIGDMVFFTTNKEPIANKAPLNIISVPELDHGIAVPLFYLMRHLPAVPIVPIYFSMLDNQTHYEFGRALKDVILNSDKRIAVIASGDLSHALADDSPAPFNPDGKIFDEKLIKNIQACDSLSIINMDTKLTENAKECGFKSILILMGILADMKCQPEILCYESPFGVGYLTAHINLN